MTISQFRELVDFVIFCIQNGCFWAMVESLLQAMRLGASFLEGMEQQKDTYWTKKIDAAVDEFKLKYPIPDCKVDIKGYEEYKEAIK